MRLNGKLLFKIEWQQINVKNNEVREKSPFFNHDSNYLVANRQWILN